MSTFCAYLPSIFRKKDLFCKLHLPGISWLKVHMHEIVYSSSFFTFFWHHSIKYKAEVQTFKNFVKLSLKFSYIIGFSRIPRYRQKRTVSLRVFGENATFHSAYSPKSRNFAPSLNMLYTAESARLTPRFRQQRLV